MSHVQHVRGPLATSNLGHGSCVNTGVGCRLDLARIRCAERWLSRATAAGLVQVEGTGKKTDPFRYWVPAAEARWRANPLYDHLEQQARDLKLPFVPLRARKRRQGADSDFGCDLPGPAPHSGRIWPPGSPVD